MNCHVGAILYGCPFSKISNNPLSVYFEYPLYYHADKRIVLKPDWTRLSTTRIAEYNELRG